MPWCETLRKLVIGTLCWLGYFWHLALTLNFQGHVVSQEWRPDCHGTTGMGVNRMPWCKRQPLCDLEAEENVRDRDDLRCRRFRRLILVRSGSSWWNDDIHVQLDVSKSLHRLHVGWYKIMRIKITCCIYLIGHNLAIARKDTKVFLSEGFQNSVSIPSPHPCRPVSLPLSASTSFSVSLSHFSLCLICKLKSLSMHLTPHKFVVWFETGFHVINISSPIVSFPQGNIHLICYFTRFQREQIFYVYVGRL